MAYTPRDAAALHAAWSAAPDWWGARVILGTSCADELTYSGAHRLILALGGNDSLEVLGVHGALGNAIFGGGGDDTIFLTGDRNFVSGGSGNDFIDTLTPFNEETQSFDSENNHNVLLGGAGDDGIVAYGRHNLLDGGSGNDGMSSSSPEGVFGRGYNILNGGTGDDNLVAYGIGDRLNGGPGNDILFGLSATREIGGDATTTGPTIDTAQVLTGGSGQDTFAFYNVSTLLVENDQDGELSQGDVVTGLLPVVTDYRAGDTIDIREGGNNRETGAIILGGSPSGEGDINLGIDTHAIIRGDMTEPGHFLVNSDGDDQIIIYNNIYNSTRPASGAVVLLDYTGEVAVRNYSDEPFFA